MMIKLSILKLADRVGAITCCKPRYSSLSIMYSVRKVRPENLTNLPDRALMYKALYYLDIRIINFVKQ